jgi:hypothetical protein
MISLIATTAPTYLFNKPDTTSAMTTIATKMTDTDASFGTGYVDRDRWYLLSSKLLRKKGTSNLRNVVRC